MTPLILDAKNRTKENVSVIRHVYIEVDDNGTACLNKIKAELPEPAFILRSSRKGDFDAAKQQMNADDKYQFIWRVTGFEKESQERLLARLIELFGGDPQCKDCVRILRLPGFKNTKYKERPAVETISVNPTREYTSADFPLCPTWWSRSPASKCPERFLKVSGTTRCSSSLRRCVQKEWAKRRSWRRAPSQTSAARIR